MSSIFLPAYKQPEVAPDLAQLPPLESGDHLDQKTFHARYEAMPSDCRAELIGGIVFMPSPLKLPHGNMHLIVSYWVGAYMFATPGTKGSDNVSTALDPKNEHQPDVSLRITVPGKGQTQNEKGLLIGPPELIVEVASSSESIDLHRKRAEYERVGVKEYIVVVLRQQRVIWFIARNGRYEELPSDPDGVLRSEIFPGLWLDPDALLREDGIRLNAVLQQGLASPEHAAFVARLGSS